MATLSRPQCGVVYTQDALRECSMDDVNTFAKLSVFLDQNPGNIDRIYTDVVFLGDNRSLSSCKMTKGPLWMAQTANRSMRLLVDAQYVNAPRCCNDQELTGLFTDQGKVGPWTHAAAESLRRGKSEKGLDYVQLWPHYGVCTFESPCPFLVHMAGDGDVVPGIGDPWLLIQGFCDKCREELSAVMIAPAIPMDLVNSQGVSEGASDPIVEEKLIPLVEEMLHRHEELDKARVYVIAMSKGVDTALRCVLRAPHIFSMAIFSGLFVISEPTKQALSDPQVKEALGRGRLKRIQFHIGDLDRCFSSEEFFTTFSDAFTEAMPADINVDLRIYPESKHNVWYAAWNALHEVIWLSIRSVWEADIPLSCHGIRK